MANNFYQIEKEINGKKYVAQYGGISVALKAVDQSYVEPGNSNTSMEKMAEYLLKNVIVEPKNLTVDDFESMDEFNQVIAFARGVMQGEFRDKKDEGTAEKAGRK